MRQIELTKGQTASVDDEDYDRVAPHSWYAMRGGGTWYAASRIGGRIVLMHRLIMNAPVGMVVDHRNHDGLCNLKLNLRVCTQSQNGGNARKAAKNRGFKGVYKLGNRFVAYIRLDRKKLHLGCFGTAEEAAHAYDAAARRHFGEFALTNF